MTDLIPWLPGDFGQQATNYYQQQISRGLENMVRRNAKRAGSWAVSSARRLRTSRSYSKTNTRRRTAIAPLMNTFQRDAALRYRYKRMPSRRRRRWVSHVRKNRAMDISMQPLQILSKEHVRAFTLAAGIGGAYGKVVGGMTIEGSGATDSNNEILQAFIDAYNVAGATTATQVANCIPYKLIIKSICFDVQIKNNNEQACIVDCYLLKCRRRHDSNDTVHTHYSTAVDNLSAVASSAVQLASTDPSVSVFDAPDFCSVWKVLNKTELIISSGQTVTKQIRDPRNHYIDGRRLTDCPQAMSGMYAMLFTWHGSPADLGASTYGLSSTDLIFTAQTMVHYAVPPGSLTKEAGGAH